MIIGIVVSKNDWGLLAMSVSHALINRHVDKVYVANHCSSDLTHPGLLFLKEHWKDRLEIINLPDMIFDQELITNGLISMARSESPRWIYVFDSDEFMVTKNNRPLTEILNNFGHDVNTVRYELKNFISLSDFDLLNIDGYSNLIYESVPTQKYSESSAYRSMYDGSARFFDYPFPSKIIISGKKYNWLQVGAHNLSGASSNGDHVRCADMYCVHLTYAAKSVLQRKVMHGVDLMKMKSSFAFGWQTKLLTKLHSEGRLDWFWDRHSIDKEKSEANPPFTINRVFQDQIQATAQFLKSLFPSSKLSDLPQHVLAFRNPPQHQISIGVFFEALKTMQQKIVFLNKAAQQKTK